MHGYLKDCIRASTSSTSNNDTSKLDYNKPLYIIELGTGSGKFSYFMLKALDELQDDCDFPFNKIVYVMTGMLYV